MSANYELFLNQNADAEFVLCHSHIGYTIFFSKSIELRRFWDKMKTTCGSSIVFSIGMPVMPCIQRCIALYPIALILKVCKGGQFS